jgi:CRP/FNR family transcriptional regulator
MQKENIHINCKDCGISQICLPAMLAESEISHLDSIIKRSIKPFGKGSHVYHASDEFEYLYAIRSGAFKSYVTSYTGEEQITAFHLPGEIIGFDAINIGQHNSSAVALMDSQICKIPYEMLGVLSQEITGLNKQVMRLLSKEITEDQELLLLLGQKHANEKMASLLINLSYRYKARSLSHSSFILPMSRNDLANYLGLTIETISRIFRAFKDKELIEIKGRQVYLKDMTALNNMAGIYCQ